MSSVHVSSWLIKKQDVPRRWQWRTSCDRLEGEGVSRTMRLSTGFELGVTTQKREKNGLGRGGAQRTPREEGDQTGGGLM